MSRKAIIDVGSNSIKFFVGELAEDKTIRTVLDTNDIARLGEGLDATGLISPEAMERNVASVAAFAAKARWRGGAWVRDYSCRRHISYHRAPVPPHHRKNRMRK